jgi:hypothetical protein
MISRRNKFTVLDLALKILKLVFDGPVFGIGVVRSYLAAHKVFLEFLVF